jgi:hypothetical protein
VVEVVRNEGDGRSTARFVIACLKLKHVFLLQPDQGSGKSGPVREG